MPNLNEKDTENLEYQKEVTNEIKLINNAVTKLTLDINKSQKIKGLTFGLTASLGLLNIIDLSIMNETQAVIRSTVLGVSILTYIIKTVSNQYKEKEIEILSKVKENIEEEHPWIKQKK